MTTSWEPPYTFEEKLKYAFVPPSIYIRRLAARQLRIGECEIRLLPFLTDRQKVSVDVGANKGVYTYFLARLTREVHAFEPNPKIFRILSRALPSNVMVHRVALSSKSGAAELLVPEHKGGFSNQGASLSREKVDGAHRVVHVESARLDQYDLRDVGFIKIDVEGHETHVIEGAMETIKRERPNLLIEMEEAHTKRPIEESVNYVRSLGYEGMFVARGQLQPLRRFDPEGQHRSPASREDYVFNFIFLPIE